MGVVEWAHQHSSDREHTEGNLLNCMNLKGILGDMPVCDNASSLNATYSI